MNLPRFEKKYFVVLKYSTVELDNTFFLQELFTALLHH